MPKVKTIHTRKVYKDNSKQTTETVTETKQFNLKVTNDSFILRFDNYFDIEKHILGTDIRVFNQICILSQYDTGMINLSRGQKVKIAELSGSTFLTVQNSICRLVKNGLLISKDKTYFVNPVYSWKGKLQSREKAIRSELIKKQ